MSFLRDLEEQLSSYETRAMVAEELRRMMPQRVVEATHGEDWMDEEQADWEEGR
jgi:hypothetical protein